jgi:hypothetical protein
MQKRAFQGSPMHDEACRDGTNHHDIQNESEDEKDLANCVETIESMRCYRK